jgi:hypothetical protein
MRWGCCLVAIREGEENACAETDGVSALICCDEGRRGNCAIDAVKRRLCKGSGHEKEN